ncbi:MAG: hypothetical protein U1F43_06955 [Myxococcota bacterium]
MDKPPSPKVFGILSIVFGSLVALFTLFGLVASSTGAFTGLMRESQQGPFREYVSTLQPMTTIIAVVMLAMSVWLIFIGIGQRRYRGWARSSSFIWGALGLAILAAHFAWQVLVLGPVLDRFIAQISTGSAAGSMVGGMTRTLTLASLVLYVPYPIILMVWSRKPHIVTAMDQ